MPRLETARVICNARLSDRLWWCEYDAPQIAGEAAPGQFAHVLCGPEESFDPLLRRPLSFSRIEPEAGRVAFLIQVVGRGTDWLVRQAPGTPVSLLGPLGNRFQFQPGGRCALLVGGGVGLGPLIALAGAAPASAVQVVLLAGGRDCHAITPPDYVDDGADYFVATEDGSRGHCGLVTDLVPDRLEWADQVFVCGPTAMLRAMAGLTRELARGDAGKPVFASLEARMGCAMGVCHSCVVKTARGVKRVCRDGPVFPLAELTWEWPHG